jgi:hypothetical protein
MLQRNVITNEQMINATTTSTSEVRIVIGLNNGSTVVYHPLREKQIIKVDTRRHHSLFFLACGTIKGKVYCNGGENDKHSLIYDTKSGKSFTQNA